MLKHGNIFIILQSIDNRQFAAFTSIKWTSSDLHKWYYDPNAFLIQFDPNDSRPYLCPIDDRRMNEKNCGLESFQIGPIIGSGYDFTLHGCQNEFILSENPNHPSSFVLKNVSWLRAWETIHVEIYRVYGV